MVLLLQGLCTKPFPLKDFTHVLTQLRLFSLKLPKTMKQSTQTLKPTPKTYNLLYAKSGNRCAFPKCSISITEGEVLVGEVAHIKGEAPKSARYDPAQTPDERRSYDNLILVCRIHHKVIDDDSKSYSVERLLEMKKDHELATTELTQAEVALGLTALIQGDVQVSAVNPVNSVVAGFYQHNVHNYGSPGSIPEADFGYVPITGGTKQSRFRNTSESLGLSQNNDPFTQSNQRAKVTMASGRALWLRLLPVDKQDKSWTFADLMKASKIRGGNLLETITHYASYDLTASDGIGRYRGAQKSTIASSVSFLFKVGEIWSIETDCFNAHESDIGFAYSLVRRSLPARLKAFGLLLTALGVAGNYRWVAGIEGVEGVSLNYAPPPGCYIFSYPHFLADQVTAEGLFSPGDDAEKALDGFFDKLFAECAMLRPSHLNLGS